MTNGDRREFTASGNPKPPSLDVVLDWVYRSWSELSKEVIVNSFLGIFNNYFIYNLYNYLSMWTFKPTRRFN